MQYFSYNDYMDYMENERISQNNVVEESHTKYEVKSEGKEDKGSKEKIVKILENKNYLKNFLSEFFSISKIGDIENITYLTNSKNDDRQKNTIICKIRNKEIFVLIKVISKIDTNIIYKMFEQSLNIIKQWTSEDIRNKRHPIVVPIVIYIGDKEWRKRNSAKNQINYIKFEKNRINFSYNMIDVNSLFLKALKNANYSNQK